jgi:hypothetical protein
MQEKSPQNGLSVIVGGNARNFEQYRGCHTYFFGALQFFIHIIAQIL